MGFLIQLDTYIPFRYLALSTSHHNHVPKSTLHMLFILKAILNQKLFFISQPPIDFGLNNFSQLTRWILFPIFDPYQRILNILCWIICKMDQGTFFEEIQYTKIPTKIDLTKVSLPPKESDLKDQCPIIFSNFLTNHNQSHIM